MKRILVIIGTFVVLMLIAAATMIGMTLGAIIDVAYELIRIIRYWFIRGQSAIMRKCVQKGADETMWNDIVRGIIKDDANNMKKISNLIIDD